MATASNKEEIIILMDRFYDYWMKYDPKTAKTLLNKLMDNTPPDDPMRIPMVMLLTYIPMMDGFCKFNVNYALSDFFLQTPMCQLSITNLLKKYSETMMERMENAFVSFMHCWWFSIRVLKFYAMKASETHRELYDSWMDSFQYIVKEKIDGKGGLKGFMDYILTQKVAYDITDCVRDFYLYRECHSILIDVEKGRRKFDCYTSNSRISVYSYIACLKAGNGGVLQRHLGKRFFTHLGKVKKQVQNAFVESSQRLPRREMVEANDEFRVPPIAPLDVLMNDEVRVPPMPQMEAAMGGLQISPEAENETEARKTTGDSESTSEESDAKTSELPSANPPKYKNKNKKKKKGGKRKKRSRH